MDDKYINRYKSLVKSHSNLLMSQSADISDPFVLPATVQNYNLTFDLSWKVMKEVLLHEFGIEDFTGGSPSQTLRKGFSVGLIEDDTWMVMLHVRNTLAHDYDGKIALKYFHDITGKYSELFSEFIERISSCYE